MTYAHPEIIVFGGTFDPPHDGHLQCLHSALRHFPKSQFIIMPAALAPIIGTKTTNRFSFDERLRLCRDMFDSIDQTRVKVSDFERDQPQPNYSIDTLHALQKTYVNNTLGFLMGLDQFKNLEQWKSYQDLLRQFTLIVVRRDEEVVANIEAENYQLWMENFVAKCGLSFREVKGLFYLNDVNSPESSTQIRQNLKRINE